MAEKNHQEGAGSSKKRTTSPPVFQDGKLLVKLKILKSSEKIEEDVEINNVDFNSPAAVKKNNNHVCHECNKVFSSGKALGGHMSSAHVQAKYHLKKLKINKSDKLFKRDGSIAAYVNFTDNICKICGKDFPSQKSLFGHMRCHPEREWRGMEPPSSSKVPLLPHTAPDHDDADDDAVSVDDHDDDAVSVGHDDDDFENFDDVDDDSDHGKDRVNNVVNLTESLNSWATTGQRGREALKTWSLEDINPMSIEEKKKLYDAVHQLISLVNADSFKTNQPEEDEDDQEQENSDDQVLISGNSSIDLIHEQVQPVMGGRKKFPVKKRKFNETATSDDDDSEETLDGLVLYKGKDRDKSKGKSQMGSEKSTSSEHSKDVGLHFSADHHHVLDSMNVLDEVKNDHHNDERVLVKKKKKVQKVIKGRVKSGEITPVDHQRNMNIDHLQTEVITPEKYKCRTCDKSFSSPLALGGHRSSHNKIKVHVQNGVDGSSSRSIVFRDDDDHNHHEKSVSKLLLKSNDHTERIEDASKENENVHECKICHKTFRTGQALGGHKRCHYGSSTSQVIPSSNHHHEEETDQKSVRNIHGFDLNLAPEEDS